MEDASTNMWVGLWVSFLLAIIYKVWTYGTYVAILRDGNGKGSSINFKPSVSTAVTSKPGRKEGMKAITEFFDQWSSSSAFHDKEERGIDESGRLEQQK